MSDDARTKKGDDEPAGGAGAAPHDESDAASAESKPADAHDEVAAQDGDLESAPGAAVKAPDAPAAGEDEASAADEGHDDEHVEAPPAGPELLARRKVLHQVCVGLGGCIAAAVAVPVAGFVVAPLFRKTPHEWRAVGAIADFKVGDTVAVTFMDASPLPWAGVTAKTAAWLRRVSEEEFIAYSVNCAHLGCPVRWLPDAQLFMCPCHGGVYYADGSVAAGPPPHALTKYPVRVHDGAVEIHTEPIPI